MHGRAGAWHHQRNPRISPVLSARFEGGRGCVGSGVSSFQSEAAAYADKWTIVLPDDFSDRLLAKGVFPTKTFNRALIAERHICLSASCSRKVPDWLLLDQISIDLSNTPCNPFGTSE